MLKLSTVFGQEQPSSGIRYLWYGSNSIIVLILWCPCINCQCVVNT